MLCQLALFHGHLANASQMHGLLRFQQQQGTGKPQTANVSQHCSLVSHWLRQVPWPVGAQDGAADSAPSVRTPGIASQGLEQGRTQVMTLFPIPQTRVSQPRGSEAVAELGLLQGSSSGGRQWSTLPAGSLLRELGL